MASGHSPTYSAQQAFAQPQPSPVAHTPAPSHNTGVLSTSQAASPPSKRDLKSWWKKFQGQGKVPDAPVIEPSGIFGVPLKQSITYANVAISLLDGEGRSYIYGYVPIVVAKCGVYLKEKATNVEGIFRLSGSEKRIKELRTIFDSPDRYGKGLDWDGYTVHDAANVLRRYLNQLPEPIVPLDLYERFRDPLRGHALQAVGDQQAVQNSGSFDLERTIMAYQQLITELPPLNRQLLLYILDLLAVFAAKSDENRMTSANLAAIFQPGMLSHPNHDMAPSEYRLSQDVLVFLIENQDHFLIGMSGTEADEKTVQDVQNGGTPPPATPTTPSQKGKNTVARSASNASAGADSLRKQGGIRRNVSVNSRHSRQSNGAPSPASPAYGPPLTHTSSGGGVHRSNTVPSKKSPALPSKRLQMSPGSPASPVPVSASFPSVAEPVGISTPVGSEAARSMSPASSHNIPPVTHGSSDSPIHSNTVTAGESQDRLLPENSGSKPISGTPKTERVLFQRSPTTESEKRAPNKLKKKRIPGSSNPSAQSSANSLHGQFDGTSPRVVASDLAPGTMEYPHLDSIPSATPMISNTDATPPLQDQSGASMQDSSLLQSQPLNSSEGTLKPQGSSNSLRSRESMHEPSDVEHGEDPVVVREQKEKRRLFRLSRRKDDQNLLGANISPPKKAVGTNTSADKSTTSFGSGHPRKSFTGDTVPVGSESTLVQAQQSTSNESGNISTGKEDKKGPIDWLKNRMREAKEEKREREIEKEKERFTKAPSDRAASSSTVGEPRGKSFDVRRGEPEKIVEEPAIPGEEQR